jgi:hypothetical protein
LTEFKYYGNIMDNKSKKAIDKCLKNIEKLLENPEIEKINIIESALRDLAEVCFDAGYVDGKDVGYDEGRKSVKEEYEEKYYNET